MVSSQQTNISSLKQVELPNGDEIYEINAHETAFLFNEIYVERCYEMHVPSLPDDAVIFDVGANIGMTALRFATQLEHSRIYCFEPAPIALSALKLNVAQFGDRIKVIPEALSRKPGKSQFTYYPNYSIMSGIDAQKNRDEALLKRGAASQLAEKGLENAGDAMLEALVGDKTDEPQIFECVIDTISRKIDAFDTKKLHLLKVDVERAEQDVLAGIDEKHWPRIERVIVEVHDEGDGSLKAVGNMFEEYGFITHVSAMNNAKSVGVFSMYAWKPELSSIKTDHAKQ